jgi:phosphoribosylaminoimidazole (AIR) synthetase
MGIGMVAVVAADKADQILHWFLRAGQKAWLIGEILRGEGEGDVRIV